MRRATIVIEIEYDEDCYDTHGDPVDGDRLVQGVEAGLDNELPHWADYKSYHLELTGDVEVDA